MSEEELKKEIYSILKKIAPDTEPEKLLPEDTIRKILGMDSFDYLQAIVAFSDRFGVEIPEDDYGKLQTLHDLMIYIQNTQKVK
jgi:acyl carrier protein